MSIKSQIKKRYRVVSASELSRSGKLSEIDNRLLVDASPCLTNMTVPIPEVSFGQLNPPDFYHQQFPTDEWYLESYSFEDGYVYNLQNAVVHGESGIITIDDFLIQESLYLAFPEAWGMSWADDTHLDIPLAASEIEIGAASHALCGAGGNRNYGHWWSNIVPALLIPPFSGTFSETVILMPKIRSKWQTDTLELIPEARGKAVFVDEHVAVNCTSLKFVPRITWSDYFPHPSRMKIISELKRRAGAERKASKKIYLSRADSTIRKLVNEAEIEKIATQYGFEPVVMTGKSVAEQIRIFSSATHVIGPHGAGLANVIFCNEGSVLCELHKDITIQWSIRRTASAARLRYGCLIGHDLQDPDYMSVQHDGPWHLPPEKLVEMLNKEPFI